MNKKQIRDAFRNAVFERDGHKCVFCGETKNLDAHHITDRNEMPNGGYVMENGITLCSVHHTMAESYHISAGKSCIDGFWPDQLYKRIKSSYTLAVEKSEELYDEKG